MYSQNGTHVFYSLKWSLSIHFSIYLFHNLFFAPLKFNCLKAFHF